MPRRRAITETFEMVFDGIACLKRTFPNRAFTIDGRLVGDIGEVIAALEYDVELPKISKPGHDGTASDGRRVQIKATFKDSLTFKTVPDYYLGFKLFRDGTYEEIFNGPGSVIYERYKHRKSIGVRLLSFPLKELKALSGGVPARERIPKRKG
jgi:hypothetical protein